MFSATPSASLGVQNLVQEVLTWQKHNETQHLPKRYGVDDEQRKLGNRFAKLLLRRDKGLGTQPRDVQLSPAEVALVNSVPGVPLRGCSMQATPSNAYIGFEEPGDNTAIMGDVIASTNACNRATNEVAPNLGFAGHHFEQSQAVPDIVHFWSVSNPVRLPGGHVFMKAIREEFVTATADGEKYFECSTSRNMFKKLDAGDLLLLVQTKCQQRVVAVGEVAHPAISRADNRAVLYDRLPRRLHNALNTYLDGAAAFDYVQFNKVYDLRDSNLKANDVLGYGGFRIDPRKNFGMGVLDVVETTESSIEKLRDFLDAQTVRWAMSRVDAVDVY